MSSSTLARLALALFTLLSLSCAQDIPPPASGGNADSELDGDSEESDEGDEGPLPKLDVFGPGDNLCDTVLPTRYHDFQDSHVDFGCAYSGTGASLGLVLDELDTFGNPQYNPDNTPGVQITSEFSFSQWHIPAPGVNVLSVGVRGCVPANGASRSASLREGCSGAGRSHGYKASRSEADR